jgi:hypothetical protein
LAVVFDASTPARARGPLLSARSLITPHAVSPKRKAIALAIAALADVLQLAVFPAFAEGAASPFEDALDLGVAVLLTLILGFHWRLALSFVLELVPGADLFPTWTAVVVSLPVASPAPAALPLTNSP